jgi:hypothetical protein
MLAVNAPSVAVTVRLAELLVEAGLTFNHDTPLAVLAVTVKPTLDPSLESTSNVCVAGELPPVVALNERQV